MAITISQLRHENYTYNHVIHQNPTDARNNFARHVHNEFEIILFLEGDATYIIENRRYKLKPYDLVLIPPSRYHYIQIDSNVDYERYDLLFPKEPFLLSLGRLPDGVDVVGCSQNKIIRDIFTKMDRYSEKGDEVIIDLLPGLIKEILYNVVHSERDSASEPQNMSATVSKALEYINENLFSIKGIEEVSGALFIAPTYFFRIFKEQMKISPKKYITVKRLIAAEKRIREGEKPTDVYIECGFSTYTAFYKRYVDYFGTPPSKTL